MNVDKFDSVRCTLWVVSCACIGLVVGVVSCKPTNHHSIAHVNASNTTASDSKILSWNGYCSPISFSVYGVFIFIMISIASKISHDPAQGSGLGRGKENDSSHSFLSGDRSSEDSFEGENYSESECVSTPSLCLC